MPKSVYVSITGLRLNHLWHLPVFWKHAMASMAQANATSACLSAEARSIRGVHHTLTVWTSRDGMIAYLHAEPHLSAMKVFRRIATGKVYGFETEHIPSWTEARRLWDEMGREV